MKKQIFFFVLALLSVSRLPVSGQGSYGNYHTIETAISEDGDCLFKDIFYTPFGEAEQEIRHGIGPKKQDWLIQTIFNSRNLISQIWLPVIKNYHVSSKYPPPMVMSEAYDYYGRNEAPYSLQTYEDSPLCRPIKTFGAGGPWHDNNKAEEISYGSNGEEYPCRMITTTDERGVIQLKSTGSYAVGELSVTRTTDEDGKSQCEFKNKLGQIVMTQQTCDAETLSTYFIYDSFGNLRIVLPPLAINAIPEVSILTETHEALHKYAFLYKYDCHNRCIGKKLPGCDWNLYMYDKADHLIFSQDGEQRKRGEYSGQFSDPFGRIAITGIYKGNLDRSMLDEQQVYMEFTPDSAGACYGYTLHGLSIENLEILNVNYYDAYDYKRCNASFTSDLDYVVDSLYDKRNGVDTDPTAWKGLLTGSMSTVLENGQKLYSANYYDFRKRPIQVRSKSLDGRITVVKSTFSFTGKVINSQEEYGDSISLQKHYTYDHADRLKEELHTIDGINFICFMYIYDDLGRLKEITRSDKEHSFTIQQNYNIRNWLTGISSPHFSQTLHYTDSLSSPCYNGNISAMTWCTDSSTIKGYKFAYDGLTRMTDAIYGEGELLTANVNQFNEQIAGYDKLGNILGLKRFGQTGESSYGIVDDLSLSYDGNQLKRVNDNAVSSVYNNGFEFKNGIDQPVEYFYDSNGNLTQDLNKKIANIQYNCLNLPSRIKFEDGNSISYFYASDGTKLRTTHVMGKDSTVTDYCGNVIYEDEIAKTLLTETGYFSLADGKYHYHVKDHQGNNRVVVDEGGKVEEWNDYYPFGGLMASSSGSVQPYKYNGKELDRKGGLDWYDYGARQYDAALGRWHAMDPMAEEYYPSSPYAYCVNNPIKYIDPDGGTVVIWYKNSNGQNASYSYSGGNVTHANPFVQSVITAYQYNKANGAKAGNGGGASTVAIVENTKIKVNVTEATIENSYNPDAAHGAGSIYWKSDWGSQNDNGTVNSPATIFDHEADHALEHKTNTHVYEVNRVKDSDPQYETKEERRVITGSEQKTSRANGETRPGQVTRRNHNGKTVITKGVTSNVIDKQKTQEYEKRKKATWTSEP